MACCLSGCSGQTVGYRGPLPSSEARCTLAQLWAKTLPAGSVAFTANAITPYSFLVGPWGGTVLARDVDALAGEQAAVHRIPVFTDGDIADLHVRCAGVAPVGMASVLSDRYRRHMTGR